MAHGYETFHHHALTRLADYSQRYLNIVSFTNFHRRNVYTFKLSAANHNRVRQVNVMILWSISQLLILFWILIFFFCIFLILFCDDFVTQEPHTTIHAGTTNSLHISCVINYENDIYDLFTPHTFLMQNRPKKHMLKCNHFINFSTIFMIFQTFFVRYW